MAPAADRILPFDVMLGALNADISGSDPHHDSRGEPLDRRPAVAMAMRLQIGSMGSTKAGWLLSRSKAKTFHCDDGDLEADGTSELGALRAWFSVGSDLAAECRKVIYPLKQGSEVTVQSSSRTSAKVVEGATCPSCLSWWSVVAIRLATDRRGFWSVVWWRDTFACWAAAAVLTASAVDS